MKYTLTLLLTSFSLLANSQVTIDETVFINSGAVFYSDGDVTITSGGLLQVEGELILNAELTGDDLVQLEPTASLVLNGGTLTLSNETDEEFADLTLGTAGFVEVPAGNSLTLTGDLDNQNSGEGLKLLAAADGTYGQLLTIGTITNKGTTYTEQYFSAATNPGWRQFGFPVVAPLSQIDDDFETYYPNGPGQVGTADQWNVKYWIPIPSGGVGSPAVGWDVDFDNSEVIGPDAGIPGYTMYAGGLFDIYNNGILDVSGAAGNGDYDYFTYPASATAEQTTEDIGWNLVPNPYPSNIDVNALLTDVTNFPLAYKAIHVWDSKTGQYQAITDDVSITFTGPTNAASTVNIAPFQAFWVKGSTTVNQSITLKNTHRTVATQGNFFKTQPDLIRLNATAANGDIDQIILTFEEGATDDIENRDAFKIRTLNEEKPSLYTSVQGKEISINRMSKPVPDKHVPLFFEQKDKRESTIDMVEATVDPSWMIELEDHKMGRIENLRDNDYTFTNDPSYVGNRFTVHIDRTGKRMNNPYAGIVNIFGNEDGLNVTFANFGEKQVMADVLITNLAGQIFYDGSVSTQDPFVFPVSGVTAMYIVHVTVGAQQEVGKVVK